MPPQGENLCVTGTLFLFGRPSLTVAGIACDIWRTSFCDGARVGNRGGGGGITLYSFPLERIFLSTVKCR